MEYLTLRVEGNEETGTRVHLTTGDSIHKPTPYVGCPIAGVLLASRMLNAVAENLVEFQKIKQGKECGDVRRVREATVSAGDPTGDPMQLTLVIEANRKHNEDQEELVGEHLPAMPVDAQQVLGILSMILGRAASRKPKDIN